MFLKTRYVKQKHIAIACLLAIGLGVSSNANAITACSDTSSSHTIAVCFDINTTTPSIGANVTVSAWVEEYQNGRWIYAYGDVKIYDGAATLIATTSSTPNGTTPVGVTFETTGQHVLHANSGLVGDSDSIAVNVSKFNTAITLDPPASTTARIGDTINFISHTHLYHPSATGLLLLYGIEPGTTTPTVLSVTPVSAITEEIIRPDTWSLTLLPNGNFTRSGDYSFWVSFTGDELNASVQSNVQHVLVGPFATSTSLTLSNNSTLQGNPETLTAVVEGTNPNHTIPTGTVSYYDSANLLGTGSIDTDGTATITISTPSPTGSHSIYVVYSGDTDNQSSTSAPVTLDVSFNPAILIPITQLLLDN